MKFAISARATLTSALIVGTAISLSACATASNCAGWSAIQPSRSDKLTTGTKQQILAHNEFGAKQGCWRGR